ncbi:MAG: hypothetical protein AAFV43_11395 [Planctomycetota bacterium]
MSSHARPSHDGALELPAGDSFLDVVANLVGILVLLVVVVGVRSAAKVEEQHAPSTVVDVAELVAQAEAKERELLESLNDGARVADQVRNVMTNRAVREATRQELAGELAQLRAEVEQMRLDLEPDDRRSAETRLALARAQERLDELTTKQVTLIGRLAEADNATTIEAISSTIVTGHRRTKTTIFMRDDRVAVFPDEQLEQALRRVYQTLPMPNALNMSIEHRRSVGSINGFEIEMVFAQGRRSVVQRNSGRTGSAVGYYIKGGTLDIGGDNVVWEPLENAMKPGSRLMLYLSSVDPEETAIVLKPSPDSFDSYHDLKRHLIGLGYGVVLRSIGDVDVLTFGGGPAHGWAVN